MQNSLLNAQAYQANSIGKLTSGSITTLWTVFAYKGVVFQPLIRMGIFPPRLENGNTKSVYVCVCVCEREREGV